MNKKTKIFLIILVVLIALTVGSVVYQFDNTNSSLTKSNTVDDLSKNF